MKNLVFILAISAFCALAVNGFLFKPKFKDGCDPNPCKKGQCMLNSTNKNISTCICPEGYHGAKCDLKTGCYAKPCKKGNCTNQKLNPSNYTCKCEKGFVGPKCDTTDACAKNPCKNNATCSLDTKLKPVCSCKPGWGSSSCKTRNCSIEVYKLKNAAKGSAKVYADKNITNKMEEIDNLAKLCHVKIYILKSFNLHPDSKAVTYDIKDKTNPNFYIGQALSFHVYDEEDKLLCNDVCLAKVPIPQAAAKCFVSGLNAINLKWSILDPTVIHTGYHVANILTYNHLREHHQVGCRENKFT